MNLTVFCCYNSLYGHNSNGNTKRAIAKGIHKVELPCSSRLDPLHVLKAFENGADGVVVIACPEKVCRMQKGSKFANKRTAYIKHLMVEAGLNPDRLMIFHPDVPSAPKFAEIVAEAKTAISRIEERAAV